MSPSGGECCWVPRTQSLSATSGAFCAHPPTLKNPVLKAHCCLSVGAGCRYRPPWTGWRKQQTLIPTGCRQISVW